MNTKQEIIEKYPTLCHNCELARKTAEENEQKGYVGCVLRLLKNGNIHYDYDEIQEAKEIAEGWIYNKRRPFTKKEETGFMTGVMTNFQLITLEVKKCKQFKEL